MMSGENLRLRAKVPTDKGIMVQRAGTNEDVVTWNVVLLG